MQIKHWICLCLKYISECRVKVGRNQSCLAIKSLRKL
nr:MAG TPA: hypothetical protein [Caudoviricetes sp.]